jgi:D-arginine utilization repressor
MSRMIDPLLPYIPISEAIAQLFAPHAEVVLHDLKSGTIRHIANCFSKRRPGDDSLTDIAAVDLNATMIGPYAKTNWDGRRLKSMSVVIRSPAGKPVGLMCINHDVEAFSAMAEQLLGMIALPSPPVSRATLFTGDWREQINERIGSFLAERSATLAGLQADDVNALIASLDSAGVFEIRNAVSYVADVLSISRATLYNRLKAIRLASEPKETRNARTDA